MLILETGQLKLTKKKYNTNRSGFSLLEIVVVISIITILALFLSLSTNILNFENKIPSIQKKIYLIENEFNYLKQYSLSKKAVLKLNIHNTLKAPKLIFVNKKSFEDCEYMDENLDSIFIYPSGKTSKLNLICNINKEKIIIKINNFGEPYLDE
tara:strand:+ start:878 stop:1339 length:462 start_codon:yes stop_codon:yes gene_type:complete